MKEQKSNLCYKAVSPCHKIVPLAGVPPLLLTSVPVFASRRQTLQGHACPCWFGCRCERLRVSYPRQAETHLFFPFFFPTCWENGGKCKNLPCRCVGFSRCSALEAPRHKKNWWKSSAKGPRSQQALFIPVLNFPADEEQVILGDTTQSCACKLKSWAPHACWEAAHRRRTLAAGCASRGHICGGFAARKGLFLHSRGKM